jgi:hypothetical protein
MKKKKNSGDQDIEKFEEKESKDEAKKKEEAKIESILTNINTDKLADLDLENYGDVGELIDEIGAIITACRAKIIQRLLKGKKVSAEDDYTLTQLGKQFKELQNVYNSMLKMRRIDGGGRDSSENDKSFLQKIKQKSTTIGSIVRDIPQD